ncbi:MAG: FAD-dependent oxidoreductase [Firmicutes bacterium]|nr:FAD-dependent oxidoreductase [Bacillota bacterium]
MSQHLPTDEVLVPPCQAACPIHQGIREYIYSIATGNFDEALDKIRETNPLPAICGTICAHHCEEECRRNDVDKPLSIRGLKRFAVENGKALLERMPKPDPEKKVAVIGGGPSGLVAAWDLAMQGCAVTVFDREKLMGGAVRHYIPLYRLPDEEIERDVKVFRDAGIEFKDGVELGKDISIAELKDQGYGAILLALGLQKSRTVPIPGVEHPKVLKALPFLKAVKRDGFLFEDNPTVIVIGGGNVAMDVARSSVRCGAKKVKAVCLEAEDEMPAFEWEIEEAREEGVEIICSNGPVSVLEDGDNIKGLKIKECVCVFDDQGRFSPEYNEDCTGDVEGDIIIFSVGQGSDLDALKDEVELNDRGNLVYDRNNFVTSQEGVFACGEVATGPGTAVESMASGRRAALSIMSYLGGQSFTIDSVEEPEPAEKLDEKVAGEVKRSERQEMILVDPVVRVTNFEHVESCFSRQQALTEAKRCLGCLAGASRIEELCVNCLTCLRVCPYGVPVIDDEGVINIRKEQCQACGLCMGICPAVAIEFRSDYIEEAASRIESVSRGKDGKEAVVVFSCAYGAYADPAFTQKYILNKDTDLGVVRFPCVSKVDSLHILKAFEAGAERVVVVGCEDEDNGDCPFRDTFFWGERRVQRAREVLGEIGIAPERVIFATLSQEGVGDFERAVRDIIKETEESFAAAAGEK